MSFLRQLETLLPAHWPARNAAGNHPEDYWAQAELDLILGRDPSVTGSALAVRTAGSPYKGSGNHEVAERCVESLRNSNAAPLMESLRKQERNGHLCLANRDETNSPYRGFYSRSYCAGLLRFGHRSDYGEMALRWLGREWWLLEECEWPARSANIYPPGTRWHPGEACPEFRAGQFLNVLRGESVDTSHRQMGHAKGSVMAGGMPVAAVISLWLSSS